MVPAPNGVKNLREFLIENKIDVDNLNVLLERYLNKQCQDSGVMAENYQLFVYKEVVSNFNELINWVDGN